MTTRSAPNRAKLLARMELDQACLSSHTPCPEGYLAWHEWAEKKAKTHRQVKCKGCGLYALWVPKARKTNSTERTT